MKNTCKDVIYSNFLLFYRFSCLKKHTNLKKKFWSYQICKGRLAHLYTHNLSRRSFITPAVYSISFLFTSDFSICITPEFFWLSIYTTPAPIWPFKYHTYRQNLFLPFVCFTGEETTIRLFHLNCFGFSNTSPCDVRHCFITPVACITSHFAASIIA